MKRTPHARRSPPARRFPSLGVVTAGACLFCLFVACQQRAAEKIAPRAVGVRVPITSDWHEVGRFCLPAVCDPNRDGRTTFDDIDPFVAAMVTGVGPGCDCNRDGRVNFDDIDSFVAALATPPRMVVVYVWGYSTPRGILTPQTADNRIVRYEETPWDGVTGTAVPDVRVQLEGGDAPVVMRLARR